MSSADNLSLQAIQEQLNTILEARIVELMTHIKAAQSVARQIARTEEEIGRQKLLREQLESELGPLRAESAQLQGETEALQGEVDSLLESISRMRNIREELMAIKGAPGLGSRASSNNQ